MSYRKEYKRWLDFPGMPEELRLELESMRGDEEKIKESFCVPLKFGTGGIRGIRGAGSSRMNVYTISRATQGLAEAVLEAGFDVPSCVIAYDPRHKSREFSVIAAEVLAANGIKTYLFREVTPTPVLSYAVRQLGASAGIVMTASHNPREYNGYKAYWSDGAQVDDDRGHSIIDKVEAVPDLLAVEGMDREEAEEKGLIVWLDDKMKEQYLQEVLKLSLYRDKPEDIKKNFSIVYSPFHGTGLDYVMKTLAGAGFENVFAVPEQAEPDGDFPTASYPNPEDPKAWALPLEWAGKRDADVVLATDPDADRMGVAAKDTAGEYRIFSGNQLAALLIDYVCRRRKENECFPDRPKMITTVVSSKLPAKIAEKYGVGSIEVFTGFKYIAAQMGIYEKEGTGTTVFGFEESIGYLFSEEVRDKDGVQAALMVAEMAAYHKSRGKGLFEVLEDIFSEYGYYREYTENLFFTGLEGAREIRERVDSCRRGVPAEIGGRKVLVYRDYLIRSEKDMLSGTEKEIPMAPSNVLQYLLEGDAWVCMRPSGTEPKLKIYFGAREESPEAAEETLQKMKEYFI